MLTDVLQLTEALQSFAILVELLSLTTERHVAVGGQRSSQQKIARPERKKKPASCWLRDSVMLAVPAESRCAAPEGSVWSPSPGQNLDIEA
jgi:hypothetical protein